MNFNGIIYRRHRICLYMAMVYTYNIRLLVIILYYMHKVKYIAKLYVKDYYVSESLVFSLEIIRCGRFST